MSCNLQVDSSLKRQANDHFAFQGNPGWTRNSPDLQIDAYAYEYCRHLSICGYLLCLSVPPLHGMDATD